MFKEGDIVTCVDTGSNVFLTKGRGYTVVNSGPEWTWVVDNSEKPNTYFTSRFKLKEQDTKKMSQFVKEVTTYEVKDTIDSCLSNGAAISVAKDSDGYIQLVVGASYGERTACYFSKDSIEELIKVLTEIKDAMNG